VRTADVLAAESIANRISTQLGPSVAATRARYLSATPRSPPLQPLPWAGEPLDLYICDTCSSGQPSARRLKAHVKTKHGNDMVSAPTATRGQHITFGNDARAIPVIEHVAPFNPLECLTPRKRALVELFVDTSPAKLPCVTGLSAGVSARNVCQFLAETRLHNDFDRMGISLDDAYALAREETERANTSDIAVEKETRALFLEAETVCRDADHELLMSCVWRAGDTGAEFSTTKMV
jgi:hypothetical protein